MQKTVPAVKLYAAVSYIVYNLCLLRNLGCIDKAVKRNGYKYFSLYVILKADTCNIRDVPTTLKPEKSSILSPI